MGLDIWSSDDTETFHIGYIGFSVIRSYFILHYDKKLFEDYTNLLSISCKWNEDADIMFDELLEKIGDLRILIDHSDCDGELSSDECKRLRKCLFVDEDKIREVDSQVIDSMIKQMYNFIDIVNYCAERDDVKLIFG